MRCNNCGLDYIADNAMNCPRCGANLGMPGHQQPPQQYQQQYPEQQYQQQPQQYPEQQYQQSPQGPGGNYQQPPYQQPQGGYVTPQGSYYQPPMPPKRVPTVKRVDLTEILMLVSGMFLLVGAFGNFAWFGSGVPAGIVVLGILTFVSALMIFVDVLMPSVLKQLGEIKDILMLVLAAVLILWAMVAVFADTARYGVYGPDIFAGGFALLMAGALRMGILK